MANQENAQGKTDHEKEELPVESLEISELEPGDLEDVSGGSGPIINKGCNLQCSP